MSPGVKSLATSFLLTCFFALIAAQSVPPLRSIGSAQRLRAPSPIHKLASNAVEEVCSRETGSLDVPQPELEDDDIVSLAASTATGVPLRDHGLVPFCSFWAGRLRRQIASAEPDDH
jgi:hypothetical protein